MKPEKYSYYKLSNEVLKRMENGEVFSSELLKEFKVDEKELHSLHSNSDCVVQGHSSIQCVCSSPLGNVIKNGSCDIYYANQNGQWVYCYTRCQSCISVCQST